MNSLKNQHSTHLTKMEVFYLTEAQLAEQAAAAGVMDRLMATPLDRPFIGICNAPSHSLIFTATPAIPCPQTGLPVRSLQGMCIKGSPAARQQIIDGIVGRLKLNPDGVQLSA